MRRLLTCAAVVAATLVVGLLAARVVGALSGLQATALLAAGECDQPCWQGIQPGHTTLAEAEAALRVSSVVNVSSPHSDLMLRWASLANPVWRGSAFRMNPKRTDEAITFVELKPPQDAFHLGDAITIFGEPVVSTLCWRFDAVPGNVQHPFLAAHVYFPGNIEVLAYNPLDPRAKRYVPDMAIWSIIYDYPASEPPYRFDAPRWRGFTSAPDDQIC